MPSQPTRPKTTGRQKPGHNSSRHRGKGQPDPRKQPRIMPHTPDCPGYGRTAGGKKSGAFAGHVGSMRPAGITSHAAPPDAKQARIAPDGTECKRKGSGRARGNMAGRAGDARRGYGHTARIASCATAPGSAGQARIAPDGPKCKREGSGSARGNMAGRAAMPAGIMATRHALYRASRAIPVAQAGPDCARRNGG